MYFSELGEYVGSLGTDLSKLDISTEMDEAGHLIVVSTKETYVYRDEEEADTKVDEARKNAGFMEAKKKFKQGKVNKNGEITKPDTWTVVVKLAQ